MSSNLHTPDPSDSDRGDSENQNQDTSIRIAPFDLGDDKNAIRRSLELNRQLLHDPHPKVIVDSAAVREKINELLDRLSGRDGEKEYGDKEAPD
ncbi:hypothetical protein BSZ35_18570 [Salinibacter sp. 10B]|nr:hypothetical protein BSZ35_18570 [Salinibacter sp. 10B]